MRKEAKEIEEKLVRACTEAGIHKFIMSLPEGYGTHVGAKGAALSGVCWFYLFFLLHLPFL